MNTKGRYGYLINIITTLFDFIILNLVYLFVFYFFDNVTGFGNKVIWLLLNISYCPAIFMFSEVHKKRILFADKMMILLFQAFSLHFLIMMAFTTLIGYDSVPLTMYAYFYSIYYLCLSLWWLISRKIIKFFRKRG